MAADALIGSDSSGGSARGARLGRRRAPDGSTCVEQRLEREPRVGDDRVAHRRPRGLVGVARDRTSAAPSGSSGPGDVRVVGEHRRADDEDQVVARERLGERPDRRRQHAAEVRVALGEADPPAAGRGRRPHRQPRALGELDRRVPRRRSRRCPGRRRAPGSRRPRAAARARATAPGRRAARPPTVRGRAGARRVLVDLGAASRPSGSRRTPGRAAAARRGGSRARSRAGRPRRAAARSSTSRAGAASARRRGWSAAPAASSASAPAGRR